MTTPKTIAALRFDKLTFVLNDGDPEDENRWYTPINKSAQLVHVSKARRVQQPRTIEEAIKCYAPTKTGREIATKAAIGDSPGFLIAIKGDSVDSARRECVGIISRANYTDSQNETITREALREATLDLASRVGTKAFSIDRNHKSELNDVALRAVWPGSGGVGDDDATYCLFSFPEDSKTWQAIKSNACAGFSWSGPVQYASE